VTQQQRYILGIIIILISGALFLNNQKREQELPNAIGDPLELIIIKDSRDFNNEFYNNLNALLNIDLGPAPQNETMLKLIEIENEKFKGIFKRHKNLLITSQSDNFSIKIRKNLFANNQSIIFLECPSIESLTENKIKVKNIAQTIKELEIQRLGSKFKGYSDKKIIKQIKSIHNISLLIPKDFFIAHSEVNFTWLRRETPKLSQGLAILTLNKTIDKNDTEKSIIQAIDSVLKTHIQGPAKNSYMVSEPDAPILSTNTQINDIHCVTVQSLWKMKNDFMGGIFKAYYFDDSKLESPIIIYTYLYAPGEKKNTPMLQLESIVHTLKY